METTKYGIISSQNVHFITTLNSKQKTYLTKVVKAYAIIMEMMCRPLDMESFGHKMFIVSQP